MKLIVEYDINDGAEGGTPDPAMARLIVESVQHEPALREVIEGAVARVADATRSRIDLGRRDIRIDRSSPTIYGIRE